MARCIFCKPNRRLRMSQGLSVINVMLGAAVCLELQAELNSNQPTVKGTPSLGELHRP